SRGCGRPWGFEQLEDRCLLAGGSGIMGLGVIGDSLSDEYAGEWYAYARNWVELLAQEKGAPLGTWSDWGEPRREGYQFNWARSGANSTTMLAAGQHTGVAAQGAAGSVSHAVMAIGQNDFFFGAAPYISIYEGQWSEYQIFTYTQQVVDNIRTAVDTLTASGVKLLLSNVIDYGVAPTVRSMAPDADKRERVTDAIADLNDRLAIMARDLQIPLVDAFGFSKAWLGTNHDPILAYEIAGETVYNAGGIDPHYTFVLDGIHPHTIPQAIFANLFLEGLAQGYGVAVDQFTEKEMAALVGWDYDGAGTYEINYGDFIVLPSVDGPASVGDWVWLDSDGDGIQGAGEPGVGDVAVSLFDAGPDGWIGGGDDRLVDQTVTDPAGFYRFDNLPAGRYYLRFDPPDGFGFSPQNRGLDTVDSDPDPTTGNTGAFTLVPGENDTTRDAGLVRYAWTGPDPDRPGQESLFVRGTAQADRIRVGQSADGILHVVVAQVDGTVLARGAFAISPDGRVVVDAGEGPDQVYLRGSVQHDGLLRGGPGGDVLRGGPGDDRLEGGEGNDVLSGMAGDDQLWGGPGDDVLRGRVGNDRLEGGDGNDLLFGHAGDDSIGTGGGNDRAYGGGGDDRIVATGGVNRLYGHAGNDKLYGGPERDYLFGSSGDDYLEGNGGVDRLFGHAGDDTLLGVLGNDLLSGGPGNDRLWGGYNNDRLYGGPGDDQLHGHHGKDALYGSSGMDRLVGGPHDDRLYGGDGNDILVGGDGNDQLYGNRHRDLLIGGAGQDTLSGSSGEDILIGGPTKYDANDQALEELMAEWSRDIPIDERIYHLEVGVGPNGYQLVRPDTVFDDDQEDLFRGGADSDWFLYFAGDQLLDRGPADRG
ncbi:MAG TPA: hypothetical protein EYP56_14745, partial [Planctomycetaceae bacterium]|nr:hypothetical protein [Planctomycetaceae bacterium]